MMLIPYNPSLIFSNFYKLSQGWIPDSTAKIVYDLFKLANQLNKINPDEFFN